MNYFRLLTSFCYLLYSLSVSAQATRSMVVRADKIISSIQPTMWGVFFEDINMGADGGIYAELVKNRSFEFTRPLMGWRTGGNKISEGDLLVMNRQSENSSNQRFLRVKTKDAKEGDLYLVNEGFRGMGIKKDLTYSFSVMYRQMTAGIILHVALVDSGGKKLSEVMMPDLKKNGVDWQRDTVQLRSTTTAQRAALMIWFEGSGVLDLDMISLFPSDTWKKRPGGMRADLVQKLSDLKPGFMRFPGGCIVEGFDLAQRYQWKKTIGPVEERQLLINRWNTEFARRPAPDYYQTFGLGFFEYFQLAEDIGAEPLPILNCGMACQFNSAEVATLHDLDPYVQDALDLIEFANGEITSPWGSRRAKMGHPAPFHLKILGIGNENWGPQYLERLTVFTRAVHSKYPDIKLVNSSGTDPDGGRFQFLDSQLRKLHADIIDEHFYKNPEWFFANAGRYDNYPRSGSRIFCGEYAAQSDYTGSVQNRNNWKTALSEAAFMTGLERNAAVVNMASYAPLFAHIDGWQWKPDLIWMNNLESYGTPDYYVQKMYSTNRGTQVVSLLYGNEVAAGQDSLYATASKDSISGELILKIVNASGKEQTLSLSIEGVHIQHSESREIILQNPSLDVENSFDHPEMILPKESTIYIEGNKFKYLMHAYSFQIVRIKPN